MAPPDVLASQGRRQATAHAGAASSSTQLTARNDLRRELKQRRATLSEEQREVAAHSVLQHLQRSEAFRKARRIAVYDSVGTELPTAVLKAFIQARLSAFYLPALPHTRNGRLRFVRTTGASRWQLNRYAIPEPIADRANPVINPAFLDLILMPLVGFDAQGNRMGMGAGYYDRSLAFRKHRRHWKRPLLVGLAYDCQQVDALSAAPWDVPLDAIVTESGIITPPSTAI